jgi:hypothetical protein
MLRYAMSFMAQPIALSLSLSLSPLDKSCWAWWFIPVTLSIWRQRQENHEFEASTGKLVRPPHLKKKKHTEQ